MTGWRLDRSAGKCTRVQIMLRSDLFPLESLFEGLSLEKTLNHKSLISYNLSPLTPLPPFRSLELPKTTTLPQYLPSPSKTLLPTPGPPDSSRLLPLSLSLSAFRGGGGSGRGAAGWAGGRHLRSTALMTDPGFLPRAVALFLGVPCAAFLASEGGLRE